MHRVHSPGLDKFEKRALWDEVLKDFETSELGATQYCRRHKLRYGNFCYYHREHKKKQISTFIPVITPVISQPVIPKQIKIVTDKLTFHLPVDLEPKQFISIIKGITTGC